MAAIYDLIVLLICLIFDIFFRMFVRNLSIHNLNYPFPLKIVTDYINSVKYWLQIKRYISRVVQFWFLWKYFNLQLFSESNFISFSFTICFHCPLQLICAKKIKPLLLMHIRLPLQIKTEIYILKVFTFKTTVVKCTWNLIVNQFLLVSVMDEQS